MAMNPRSDVQARLPHPDSQRPLSPMRKISRILAVIAISLAGAFVFTARMSPARMDYISYWSAGQQLWHHADPYSPAAVFALEKAQGFPRSAPLIMRNPPWALFLVAPLGLMSARIGLFFWTLAIAACILISVRLLNDSSQDDPLALLFAPAIACIDSGQSSAFLLLGFALFLRFHRTRPFLVGAALLLMAIKPHLFLVFWILLLADAFIRRSFRIFAGFAAALAAATVFPMCFDARVWPGYVAMLRTSALNHEEFPTASMLFRMMIDPHRFWLVFIPSGLTILWGVWYYLQNKTTWDWRSHGLLVMLVTILASPYGWITDEIVLLPSIILALNLRQKRAYSVPLLIAINCVAAVLFLATNAVLKSPVFLWTPVAWLAWFLYATGAFQRRPQTFAAALANRPELEEAGA
jgi:hypothetical protein